MATRIWAPLARTTASEIWAPRANVITQATGVVEEVAATIEFLTSHEARNITGQTIVIDGGWTAR